MIFWGQYLLQAPPEQALRLPTHIPNISVVERKPQISVPQPEPQRVLNRLKIAEPITSFTRKPMNMNSQTPDALRYSSPVFRCHVMASTYILFLQLASFIKGCECSLKNLLMKLTMK